MAYDDVSFNLVDDPWIRVRMLDGSGGELSIEEVFHRAHEIECLANDIATQDFAILRVLLAILHRAVDPILGEYDTPLEAWAELWDGGGPPFDLVDEYLRAWHHRFDLFDSELPFMQVASMQATNGSQTEVKKIVADVPDNLPLFSTRSGKGLESLSYAEAARWLVHVQAFDTSGIKTGVVGDKGVKSGKSFPIGTGWAGRLGGVYVEGESLARTLLLNLVLCGDCHKGDFEEFTDEGDVPIWERGAQKPGDSDSYPMGPCSVYTWQARRMLLFPRDGCVCSVLLSNGNRIETHNKLLVEPMSSWRRSQNLEKKLHTMPVYLPLSHRAGRSLWRGLSSLLSDGGNAADVVAPGVLMWVGHLSNPDADGPLPYGFALKVHATGVEYGSNNSVYSELIDDFLRLNAFLLSPEGLGARTVVKECMRNTDDAIRGLGLLAKRLCLACGDDSERASGEHRAAVGEAYFELDASFREWLSHLDDTSDLGEARQRWHHTARRLLWHLGEQLVSESGPDAVIGRKARVGRKEEWVSAARAESQYRYWLDKALPIDDGPLDQEGE